MAIVSKNIDLAVELLCLNQAVAIPTETVYGLAGNALNEDAVNKIYSVKNRPKSNPLIVHVKALSETYKYVKNISELSLKIAEQLWPGPLTILFDKSEKIPDFVTSGLKKVAIRVPRHPQTLELLNTLNFPLAAPSANPFSYISPTNPLHIQKQIGSKIPMILDGGACQEGLESTIIGVENDEVIVYRTGIISTDEIEKIVGKKVVFHRAHLSQVVALGMLPYHYSPNTKLYLFNDLSEINEIRDENISIITFSQLDKKFKNLTVLSTQGVLKEAAQKFYDTLFVVDSSGYDAIYCQLFPEKGLGITLNEKLRKAAKKHDNKKR